MARKLALAVSEALVTVAPASREVTQVVSARAAKPQAYEGADRRERTPIEVTDLPLDCIVRNTSLVCIGAAIPLGVQVARAMSLSQIATFEALLSGLFAVTAGVALLICWRILGTASYGWFACALLDLGLLTMALNGPRAVAFASASSLAPLDHLIISVTAVWLTNRALHAPEVDATFSPWRSPALLTGGSLFVFGALSYLEARHLLPHILTSSTAQTVFAAITATVWVGLALDTLRGRHSRRATSTRTSVFVGLLGLTALASAAFPRDGRWLVAEATLTLLALALALGTAAAHVQELLARQDRNQLRMHLDLSGALRLRTSEQETVEEHLHELRNAVGAVCAADHALRRYAGSLDEGAQRALADALTAELGRLQVLTERAHPSEACELPLEPILEPIVAVGRGQGADIALAVGGARVHADPVALAQVVQNVLINARLYAPGSPVWIVAEELPGRVQIHIKDVGPGIPACERRQIFTRGGRGSSSHGVGGDGLGLFVSTALMADMGGSLTLAENGGTGCCFVLELPAAREAPWDPARTRHG